MAQTTLKRTFWTLGGIALIIGSYGWYDRLANGHINANYGNIVTWGLWVALYIYFIGLSAGSFLISSLVYVFNFKQFERIGRVAIFTAVVTLLLALLCIWADLGHMGRAWHVMAYPNFRSPMAWMIWLYSAYFLVLLGELWFVTRPTNSVEQADRNMKSVRILAKIGLPVAIMFHGGVGALFGVVAARPHWHSGLFPILFLLSALVSGGALLIVISAVFQDGWAKNRNTVVALGRMVLGLLLLDVLFQVSEYLVAFRGGVPSHSEGLRLLMFGPYAWVFWGVQVVLGMAIPIAILASKAKMDPKWVSLAALSIAIGFIGLRLNIVIPGLAMEEVKGLSSAISSPRMTMDYFPSVTEWLLTIGVVGIGLLLFGAGERYLPRDSEEVAHV